RRASGAGDEDAAVQAQPQGGREQAAVSHPQLHRGVDDAALQQRGVHEAAAADARLVLAIVAELFGELEAGHAAPYRAAAADQAHHAELQRLAPARALVESVLQLLELLL